MGAYVGLDVHSKKSVSVVQDGRGGKKGRGEVSTDREGFAELRRRDGLEEGTVVALESGTVAFYAARQLRAAGLRPMVIDAHEVRNKAHRPWHHGGGAGQGNHDSEHQDFRNFHRATTTS